MRRIKIVFFLVIVMFVSACSIPVTRVDVQNFSVNTIGVDEAKAINLLTNVLIDRDFDIKMTNKDAGVITTEYKKFASLERKPPFDYFMQIKGKLRETKRGKTIELTPIIKEQNRQNSAAFTEHMLGYYVGKPGDISIIRSMKEGTGWRSLAQTLFMNVVNDTAKAFKINPEDVIQNVTKTEVNAFTEP